MLSSWMQQKPIEDAPFNMMKVACHGCQVVMHEQETKQLPLCVCINYSFEIFFFWMWMTFISIQADACVCGKNDLYKQNAFVKFHFSDD